MGTLATLLARKNILTSEEYYWIDAEGDIEEVNNILKITRINVTYHLKVSKEKIEDAKNTFSSYLERCPAAQSVIGCIEIKDRLEIEEMD